ncbi:MAG: Crp/Fnr family transcriptional regulator [Bacteroidetes bacterium]|nr:Crp/Fnr family transcriptional regulator [Bacteroidota bacterium]
MEFFLAHIRKQVVLSAEDAEILTGYFRSRKLKKKHFLVQEGDMNQYSFFVVAGILRLYSIDPNGFEHIIQFGPAGWWINDMQSWLKQTPGNLYIDAIEDSEVLQVSKADIDTLYARIPALEKYFRLLAENAVAAYQQRFVSSLSQSAKDRYNSFCQLYPTLIQQLPQKHIASYIGVTPEFLSKMLNQSNNQ